MMTSNVASYSISTMANRGDYSDDNNGVIITAATLLAIAVIGLLSIVINICSSWCKTETVKVCV